MDPTNDPNFRPPSLGGMIEPPASASKIPNNEPIEPLVLADLGQPVDAPPPHPSKSKSTHKDSNVKHNKIPRKHTDLQDSSSDDEILPPTTQVKSYQIADLEEVPHGIQRQATQLKNYSFPTHRLATSIPDDKYPLVVVACGSFSPITYLHLRMFEMALDAISEQTRFECIGGYYSPVSSNYKKQGLAPAHHRVRMCELACERTSSWLMVDSWESLQPKYTRTALVLDHFNEEINVKRGGITTKSGERRGVKIMLLAGGDLIESMGEPNVWADQDLHHILGNYGCLIVERTGTDVRSFLLSHDIMYEHRKNVLVIKQLIYNDISSTKIRLFIRRGMSVQYLLPNSVIRYIQQHKLYHDSEPVKQVMSEKAE
jgi:nicotinamide mononucleotide adenylyltransferase